MNTRNYFAFMKVIAICVTILTSLGNIAAEEVSKNSFVRKYSNPHLGIVSFTFTSAGKCSIVFYNPENDKSETFHCTWKQEGQTNKLIVNWLSAKYKKTAQIPKGGDIYYIILNGDTLDSRNHCLVRKPTEYNSQELKYYDLMDISNGLPLCSAD